uniref:RING-type E3 ubiquitin transferase n=1 Tax=Gallus gallus TaxID=9031 RepID=A0A8V0YH32_CHICK
MASEPDHRCPICLDTMDDASYAMPCLHRFCFGCIRRWTQSRPTCPLCNRRLRDGASTTSPGSLCQHLTILTVRNFPPTSNLNLPSFN